MKISEIMVNQPINTPNMIIFRAPDEDNQKVFVQVMLENGKLAKTGTTFSIADPGDSYNTLDFDHVVLAKKIFGGSIDLRRYQVKENGGKRAMVCFLKDKFPPIVETLLKDYEDRK